MDYPELITILSRLSIGAVATFLAIILWSGTRDAAWMLIVMGTIVTYGQIMYSTLAMFGIVEAELYVVAGIPIVEMLFQNLPNLFFIIAFSIMISRNRIRYESLAVKIGQEEKTKKKKKRERKKKTEEAVEEIAETVPVSEPETVAEAEPAAGPDTLEEVEAAEEVEEVEEAESAEELEEIEEIEEIEEVEELDEVEEPEEITD